MTVIVDGEPSVFSKNISRVRRFVKADANSIWKSSLQEEFNYLVNRTFYANCSTKNIICSSVVCLAGPFNKRQNNAIVQMKMMFNVSSVSGMITLKFYPFDAMYFKCKYLGSLLLQLI